MINAAFRPADVQPGTSVTVSRRRDGNGKDAQRGGNVTNIVSRSETFASSWVRIQEFLEFDIKTLRCKRIGAPSLLGLF